MELNKETYILIGAGVAYATAAGLTIATLVRYRRLNKELDKVLESNKTMSAQLQGLIDEWKIKNEVESKTTETKKK